MHALQLRIQMEGFCSLALPEERVPSSQAFRPNDLFKAILNSKSIGASIFEGRRSSAALSSPYRMVYKYPPPLKVA